MLVSEVKAVNFKTDQLLSLFILPIRMPSFVVSYCYLPYLIRLKKGGASLAVRDSAIRTYLKQDPRGPQFLYQSQ